MNTSPEPDTSLDRAIAESLEGLLRALVLEDAGADRFRVLGEPGRFDRVFGGQTVAQALVAACATVSGKAPHSLHAYFAEAGAPGEPLDLVVERVRDGRSIATRRVAVSQDERPLLIAMVSFHENPPDPQFADPPPSVPGPEGVPLLQDWLRDVGPDLLPHARTWVDRPPPLDLRISEPPNFLGGTPAKGPRSHWMRLPRDVGNDAVLQTALLAYASDYFLLDMAFRSQPQRFTPGALTGFSLDHTVWFHRPVSFEHWHLYTQETLAISGHRGLIRGSIHDADGQLVASVAQEVLVRPSG